MMEDIARNLILAVGAVHVAAYTAIATAFLARAFFLWAINAMGLGKEFVAAYRIVINSRKPNQ